MTAAVELQNPFPGFRPFEEDESERFFGRRQATYDLVDRLGRSSFLAVVGVSGSGKSSLVQCGVLPALHRGLLGAAGSRWRIAKMRPRNDPLGQLAAGLARAGLLTSEGDGPLGAEEMIEAILRRDSMGLLDVAQQSDLRPDENLLVFVDQFEELFRFQPGLRAAGSDDDVAFVKLLLEAAAGTHRALGGEGDGPRVFVLLTMRSDFLGDCARYADLVRWVNEGFYLVPLLTRAARREAIEGPVAMVGAEITPRLVNRLLNDTGDDPARLPVLQHALMRTWDAWAARMASGDHAPGCDPQRLDLCDLSAAGRLDGALDLHLDTVLEELGDEGREIARRVFQRLTEVLPDGREMRRGATVAELRTLSGASLSEVTAVLDAFRREGRTFLSPREGTLKPHTLIDISHESLIARWEVLRDWMKDEEGLAKVYRPLSDKAAAWTAGEASSPYRKPELSQALGWRRSFPDEEAAAVWARPYDERARRPGGFRQAIDFLSWSVRERNKRRAWAASAAAVLLVAGGVVASVLIADARRDARRAQIEFASQQADIDPLEGALILSELMGEDDVDGAGFTLGIDLASRRVIPRTAVRVPVPFKPIDVDSARVLVISQLGADDPMATVRVLDGRTGAELEQVLEGPVVAGWLEPGGGTLVFRSGEAPAAMPPGWRALSIPRGFTALRRSDRHLAAIYGAEGDRPDRVCAWPTAPGRFAPAARCKPEGSDGADPLVSSAELVVDTLDRVRSAVFGGDGGHLVSWSSDGRLAVTDLRTGARGGTYRLGPDAPRILRDVAYLPTPDRAESPFGRLLIGALDGSVSLWDLRGAQEARRVEGCDMTLADAPVRVAFVRDAGLLAVSGDGTASRLAPTCAAEPQDPREFAITDGPRVEAATLLADADLLLATLADRSATLWHIDPPRELLELRGHRDAVVFAGLDPSRRHIVTVDAAGELRIWDREGTRWDTGPSRLPRPARLVAIDARGTRVATADSTGELRVWDRASGTPVAGPFALGGPPELLALDPRGRWIAAARGDSVVVWAVPDSVGGDPAPARELRHGAAILGLGFDAAGARLLSASDDGEVRLTATTRWTDTSFTVQDLARAVIAPDGHVATGDWNGEVRIWGPSGDPTGVGHAPEAIEEVNALAFSPGGRHLAIAYSGSVVILSRQTGARTWTEDRLGAASPIVGQARALAFVSDSVLLTAPYGEPGVRGWRAPGGDMLYELRGPLGSVRAVEGALAGPWAVTLEEGAFGQVRVWPLGWEPLIRTLRERATHACLSADRREQLLGEDHDEATAAASRCKDTYQRPPGERLAAGGGP